MDLLTSLLKSICDANISVTPPCDDIERFGFGIILEYFKVLLESYENGVFIPLEIEESSPSTFVSKWRYEAAYRPAQAPNKTLGKTHVDGEGIFDCVPLTSFTLRCM